MNFLAHILLSDRSPEIIIGNFIADFVKGNHFQHLPEGVIKGIKLHRSIDHYTDTHEIVKKDIKLIHNHFSRYSGIVIDIFYDHLLLNNWDLFCQTDKEVFIQEFYSIIDQNMGIIPDVLSEIFPNMKSRNWILNYGNFEGLQRTFLGMNNRVNGNVDFSDAVSVLKDHYEELNTDFKMYFPQLVEHVQHYRMMLS